MTYTYYLYKTHIKHFAESAVARSVWFPFDANLFGKHNNDENGGPTTNNNKHASNSFISYFYSGDKVADGTNKVNRNSQINYIKY